VSNPAVQEVPYARLGQRTLAALLDNLVWLIFLSQIAANIPQQTYEDEPIVVGVIFLALFSAWFNYFWFTEWKWGKTIGKAVVSIHVTGEDGGRPGFGPTTVRNVLRLVDVLGIGPILIANSERHQRLGDRFAHTIVVRDQRAPVTATPIPHPATSAAGSPGPGTAGAAMPSTAAPPIPPPPPADAPPAGSASPWKKTIGIPHGGWRPIHVVWGVVAMIVLVGIEAAVVSAFDPDLDSVAATLSVQALLAATLVAVALVFASRGGSLPIALRQLGLRRFARSALGLAAVTYVAYLVFAVVYNAFVHPEQEDITRELGFDEGGFGAVAAGALVVAAAPLSEEIFFRGFMYGGLRRRLPVWAAAVTAGAVFGLLHYTGSDSIGVVPQLAVLGVLLAWLYERTGSLWPPIILHVVNNALALVVVTSQ
jgi:membrane protease YdiL (CAAX protease family)/uncharacterized RDD family membrane protein YckC